MRLEKRARERIVAYVDGIGNLRRDGRQSRKNLTLAAGKTSRRSCRGASAVRLTNKNPSSPAQGPQLFQARSPEKSLGKSENRSISSSTANPNSVKSTAVLPEIAGHLGER